MHRTNIACIAHVFFAFIHTFVRGIFRLKFPLREATQEKSSSEGEFVDELSAGDSPDSQFSPDISQPKPGTFLPANGDRVFGREFFCPNGIHYSNLCAPTYLFFFV